ncbi:uncharacterized protein LOC111627914 [Centruroides sculpturatus]|uniref:uncharacterized protein LOC111627914 n=1 Tax=Centruroides sculpturatus TaxID=218467 RepID=UPI000C6DEBBF|nr:uncharacterized protein LOC111627914 [Centruroides sculpturatus]
MNYECKLCDKSFTSDQNLIHHIRVHTGEKPYICETCKKSFAQWTNLNRHIRTHTGEKPYKCVTCNKCFARLDYLNNHIRIHTGEKPYKCMTFESMVLPLKLSYILLYLIGDEKVDVEFLDSLFQNGYFVEIFREKDNFFISSSLTFFYTNEMNQLFTANQQYWNTFSVTPDYIELCKYSGCKEYPVTRNDTIDDIEGKRIYVYFGLGSSNKETVFKLQYMRLLCAGLKLKCIETGLFRQDDHLSMTTEVRIRNYMISTSPALDISTVFLLKAGKPLNKIQTFFKPFAVMVWICLCITLVLFILCVYAVEKIESRIHGKDPPKLSTICWLVLLSLLRQGVNFNQVPSYTFRVMVCVWIMMIFILSSGYLGILPSFMMNPGTEAIPQNFKELALALEKDKYIPLIFIDSSEARIFHVDSRLDLLSIKDDEINSIANSIQRNEDVSVLYEYIIPKEEFIEGNYVFISSKWSLSMLQTEWGKEIKLYLSSDILFTNFLFVQINTQLFYHTREVIRMVNIIQQSGLPDKLARTLVEKKMNLTAGLYLDEDENEVESDGSVKFEDISNHLYLLGAGYIISFFTFLLEILIDKIINWKETRN